MTRKLPFSIPVVSLLLTLPGVALAQTALPGTVPPPVAPTPVAPSPAPYAPAPAPAPAPIAPAPATMIPPPLLDQPMAPPPMAPPPPPVPMAPPAPEPPAPSYAAPAPPSGGSVHVELTSLRLMRDKGIISQAEFDSAMHDLADSAGERAAHEGTIVVGKWATTLYGFVEADSIYDSTRSFNDLAGAAIVQPGNSTAGSNSRWTFGVRNTRLGFRLKAPEYRGVRASGQLETDFLGTQLPIVTGPYPATVSPSPYGSEGTFFASPTLRVRHAYLKIETPVVDILFGQYWTLFGWGPTYQPNTVEIQGVPGEIYSRTTQFRVSKTIKVHPVSFDLAVAAMRPVQRDGGLPDGQAGIKFNVDSWTGQQTMGPAGTQLSPLSVGVSGLLRHVAVNSFNVASTNTNTTDSTVSSIAVDGFVPVIPATKDNRDNALSVQGEFSAGYGDADEFTGLTGGVGFPNPTTGTYTPDIDPGIVTFDGKGGLHGIQWTTYLFGGQYYLPETNGKVWISGNYSHSESANSHYYLPISNGKPNGNGVRAAEDWFDVNAFVDPVPGARLGLEYANFNDMNVNGIHAINHRIQFSGFFIF